MTAKSRKEEPIIQVKHISKHYNIGMDRTYKTLSGSITDAVRSPIQTLKGIGSQHDSFWALKDINFEVERGEVVGIIGRNGAGKSTLLKILSRITTPTEGEIRLRGRVGSLLEVGTGFHPELTGRENIYFNGAILGMKKREIDDKFDEIVKFSGVEKFLDTPVKRYSSGMQVRLAFSVAANLDPEILVVDEVLAVGDVQFQKKCIGKMGEVAEGGRTVLFVSHNMGAIGSLCNSSIVLDGGKIVHNGDLETGISIYKGIDGENISGFTEWIGMAGDDNVKLLHTWIKNLGNEDYFTTSSDIEIGLEVDILKPIDGLIMGMELFSSRNYSIAYSLYDDIKCPPSEMICPGNYNVIFRIPGNTLSQGSFRIKFDIGIHGKKRIIFDEGSLRFSVANYDGLGRRYILSDSSPRRSILRPNWLFSLEQSNRK